MGENNEDELRRRNEMNMFSAMALGGGDAAAPSANANIDSSDHSASAGKSSAFDAGSVVIPPKKSDEGRMKDEMSAFAAMAGGDPSSISAFAAMAGGDTSSFSAAAQGGADLNSGTFKMDSGTFNMSSTAATSTPSQRKSEQSNLDKAAAAFALGFDDDDNDDDKADKGIGGLASTLPVPGSENDAPRHQKMEPDYPMYNEDVRMPRPLFFGPIVPPRVLNEARLIVKEALKEQGYFIEVKEGEFKKQSLNKQEQLAKLSSLPPEVQNIIGALRVYGYGLSAFPFDEERSSKEEEADNAKPFWKGTSYVSTFQPVFGETARTFRKQNGILPENGQQAPEDKRQETDADQAASPGVSQHKTTLSQEQANMEFLANISSDSPALEQANSAFLASINGESPALEQANSAFLAGINGDPSAAAANPQDHSAAPAAAPPATKKAEDPQQSSEINMFSMWARGDAAVNEDDAPAAVGTANKDKKDTPTSNSKGDVAASSSAADEAALLRQQAAQAGPIMKNYRRKKAAASDDVPPAKEEVASPKPMSDRDMFSQWANPTEETPAAAVKEEVAAPAPKMSERDMFSQWANPTTEEPPPPAKEEPKKMSDQQLFSQWANPTTDDPPVVKEEPKKISDQQMFSQWANPTEEPLAVVKEEVTPPPQISDQQMFSQWANPPAEPPAAAKEEVVTQPKPMSDQDLFSQWAIGDSTADKAPTDTFNSTAPGNTFVMRENKNSLKRNPRFELADGGTFQRIPATNIDNDSDDDSIVGSELKKKVGVNEHLDKALASLIDDGPSTRNDADDLENSRKLLQVKHSTPGGRPLSNLELTKGCVPIFAIDDAPLPVEGDLGIHETKNDEQRTQEMNRSQEIIDKYVGPNVFGPVACPNPATSPDDNHSWNSRSAPSQRYSVGASTVSGGGNRSDRVGVLPVPVDSAQSPKPPTAPSRKTARNIQSPKTSGSRARPHGASAASTPTLRKSGKGNASQGSNKRGGRGTTRHRYGWWSVPEDFESGKCGTMSDQSVGGASDHSHSAASSTPPQKPETPVEDPLQLPPLYHASHNVHIDTRLQPSPEKLRVENLPLSDLHSATAMAQGLPYLSDRPPSYRYLQIDTQAVGFPPLGGEVEPLFCSLAIYNVETTSGHDGSTPMPDLQRCGRVTEVLNFDVVTDQQVEERCVGSLWPFFASSTMTPEALRSGSMQTPINTTNASMSSNPTLQGTRCGVFPLPSNLNVANLYAIITVHKVLSEDADFEIYLKQSKKDRAAGPIDLDKFRAKAEKASDQHGGFLMPFAFGVAPLLQVFGADNPVVASSRAVQIPLFRFSAGLGERQIIDHIMVMLYPRADFRANGIGGPAAVTNGGTAMLVMRNFGYLGLHAVVHSRSSLARDRLVDFTGELQIRRRNENDPPVNNDDVVKRDDHVYVVPEWHPQFIAEPAVNGGRNSGDVFKGGKPVSSNLCNDDSPSRSQLYAQELAPIALSPVPFTPATRAAKTSAPRARAPVHRADIEPYYHASFCNELLCHPRTLQNCPKGNIVMKVELREIEWNDGINGFVAHLPSHGPSIHNTRRGPFLVQGTYTATAVKSIDPHFLDEVKVKLPLTLKRNGSGKRRTLSLFFSVFNVKFNTKKKWSKVIPSGIRGGRRDSSVSNVSDIDEATGERVESEEGDRSGKCKLVLLSCGFLPVTKQSSLIENGVHDVKMMYKGRAPSAEMRAKWNIAPSSMIVIEKEGSGESLRNSQASSIFDPREDDSTNGGSRTHSEAELETEHGGGEESDSGVSEISDRSGALNNPDSQSQSGASHKAKIEQMMLQVRIVVHSSLHTQNNVLSDFLQHETDYPICVSAAEKLKTQIVGLDREEIVRHFSSGLSSPRIALPAEEKMLSSVVSVAKPQFCSPYDVTKHFLRINAKMWKTLVCGTGETDLVWANPASIIPLRVHAFASLLQVFGSASLFMSKGGVTQVDGVGKFDLGTLARVVCWFFDEETIFGCKVRELIGKSDLFVKKATKDPKGKTEKTESGTPAADKPEEDDKAEKARRRRRHNRSNIELFNDNPRGAQAQSVDMSDPTSDFGDLISGLSVPGGGSSNQQQQKQLLDFSQPQKEEPMYYSLPAQGTAPAPAPEKPNSTPAAESSFDFTNLYPPSSARSNVKVDSALDFRNNMELGFQSEGSADDSFDAPLTTSHANKLKQRFGGMSTVGKNRWKTAPAPGLTTIREDVNPDEEPEAPAPLPPPQSSTHGKEEDDPLDSEIIKAEKPKTTVKQMRVPRIKGRTLSPKRDNPLMNTLDTLPESVALPATEAKPMKHKYSTMGPSSSVDPNSLVVPKTEEILIAGSAFLDSIGANLAAINLSDQPDLPKPPRKGRHVHQRTRSRCSIDWNVIGDEPDDLFGIKPLLKKDTPVPEDDNKDVDDHDETMSTLRLEEEHCIRLPSYVDRLVVLAESNDGNGRWFPYVYEVVIMVWTAFLVQQRDKVFANADSGGTQKSYDFEASLAEAASSSQRGTVACAPLLFEVIKQSLAFRVRCLMREIPPKDGRCPSPPLVVLDDAIQSSLERLISTITDACLNSRNFDSREHRQMSIDVNDAIVRFLRDMFGFLSPASAHRLVLVYLSRFVTNEGKQWQDRDSSIGLRCSWEITKLRLNAMTALIRFPDFLRVCSPQMNNWGTRWLNPHGLPLDNFFDSVLARYKKLELSELAADGGVRAATFEIPQMRPHWLAEVVTEICLNGTVHAEQYIQQRAASLLHELFWASSQQSMVSSTATIAASMYVTFIGKVLNQSSYLSNFSPKSQLRKDILPCVVFVIQSCPSGLLRALWRELCFNSIGKGTLGRYGGIGASMFPEGDDPAGHDQGMNSGVLRNDPDILDMFTLLNMALSTMEYEGCEAVLESDSGGAEVEDQISVWHKEYLLTLGQENQQPFMNKRSGASKGASRLINATSGKGERAEKGYFSTGSRKWQSHDSSFAIVNCGHQIVTELAALLESGEGQAHLNQARRPSMMRSDFSFSNLSHTEKATFKYSRADTVIFMRAATSLYLNALALRQSDIVLVRTFKVSADLVKIFGIKMFLEAVGETLQHWMRVASFHCGARRAKVRIEATDFLELVLRCTWESYGSFFRIRIPLIAIQTEVMERIVAIAASRYYREERRTGTTLDNFSNASAEASLAPLWRTLDRLHHQPASQNIAFRGALIRLAMKLKKLYKAYVAARALSYLSGMRSPKHSSENGASQNTISSDADAMVRAYRITVLRVINASAGYSKQFLGFHGTSLSNSSVAHYEAVEDAFLDAADVFSPTELPEHRVAWLQMLVDFHSSRKRFAEQACCHFQIHATLKQASSLHGSLWSNTPFLPWTHNQPDSVHIDGGTPSGNPLDYSSDLLDLEQDLADTPYGRPMDDANSSRRIFYRVANSVRANTEDWETGLNKTLFCGVTFAAEYCSVSSWITLKEMEEKMVEEAESAGELFLEAGIVESCRFTWNLATQYYSEKFSYGKLANVYGHLSRAVVSRVPPIDASTQQEVSVMMGRFYRVWFHGGAPDELIGAEFVYRTSSWIRLDQFGEQLKEVIKCIIPDRTPIHLVLDGRGEEGSQRNYTGFSRLGPAPLEPVRIKVTPLRPLFAKGSQVRGLPEWFHRYIDEAAARAPTKAAKKPRSGNLRTTGISDEMGRIASPGHRTNNLSFGSSASVFASGGSSGSNGMYARRSSLSRVADVNRGSESGPTSAESELVGVDKFGFLQPAHIKDRNRGNKDWWKPVSGDFARKSLRVTQLQVRQAFPACVSRQAVVHRVVFNMSPLEAAADGVCQWCSVLFRTGVATNGMAVLGINSDPGIGTDAAKVVADCIHSSRVKEMGMYLLKKNVAQEESDIFQSSDRLTDDEVDKHQSKLARTIIVFLELLHLLIGRNRDLLLNLIQERRREPPPPPNAPARSTSLAPAGYPSNNPRSLMRLGSNDGSVDMKTTSLNRAVTADPRHGMRHNSHGDEDRSTIDDHSYHGGGVSLAGGAGNARSDAAIAVQSELQRSYISLIKSLYPGLAGIMQSDTPRWLKQCCQENYWSLGTYRQARLPISEELYFSPVNESYAATGGEKLDQNGGRTMSNTLTHDFLQERVGMTGSPGGSVAGSSVYSRGHSRVSDASF